MSKRLPPNIGLKANDPLLYNPYQQEFLKARRLRFASCCNVVGSTGSDGAFKCPSCGKDYGHRDAKRVYQRFGLFAGRRGGKSIIGAHGAREEILIPNGVGWVSGPTEKILHDATMPAILQLIPRDWCSNWDAEHLELTLTNGHLIMFRSLHDPDRGHCGVGCDWAWFDEAAFIDPTGWDYFRPALTDYGGAAFFTSSVDGFDWTYDRVEKPALVDHKPGFWACKWRTIDNPWILARHPEEIEEARATMPPQLFRQEYEGERENFTGAVYGEWIDECWLRDDDAVRTFIPEWPHVDASRRKIIGLDSGADHPFGGAALVVTDRGIIVVADYLERQRAFGTHFAALKEGFHKVLDENVLWAANRNEAQLRLEFSAQGISVAPAENDVMAGIQRVLSWLYSGQFKIAYTAPRTLDQMKKYRYADNTAADGQKRAEKVFKVADELPDCVRYALMTWPSLPNAVIVVAGRDLSALDPRTRWELEKMARVLGKEKDRELAATDANFPMGDFYSSDDGAGENGDDMFAGFGG